MRFLVRARLGRNCPKIGLPTIPFGGYRFSAARMPPGASRRTEEGPGRLSRSQENPREVQDFAPPP